MIVGFFIAKQVKSSLTKYVDLEKVKFYTINDQDENTVEFDKNGFILAKWIVFYVSQFQKLKKKINFKNFLIITGKKCKKFVYI